MSNTEATAAGGLEPGGTRSGGREGVDKTLSLPVPRAESDMLGPS